MRLVLQVLATLDDIHAVVVDVLDLLRDVQLQLAGVCPDRFKPFLIDWQPVMFEMGDGVGVGAAM